MVVAKPRPLVVEGDHEQVVVLELFEQRRRVLALENRIAQRPAHPVENRGPKQELELRRLDAPELLGAQVVGDEAVVTAERRKRRVARFERQRGEIQPRRPALRTLVQCVCLRLGHVQSRRCQEGVGLAIVQGERGAPELEQLAVGTQLREPQPSLGAAGEHELRALRYLAEHRGQRVETLGVLELVHIVEHEDEGLGQRGERHTQTRQGARPERGRRQPVESGGIDTVVRAQRLGEIREQDDGIVVAPIEGDPGEPTLLTFRPLGQRSGLSRSRRRHDADEAAVGRAGQPVEDCRSFHLARARRRNELGAEELERARAADGRC